MRIAITTVLALLSVAALSMAVVFHTDVVDAERLIVHHQENFATLLPFGDPTTEAGRTEAMSSDHAMLLAEESGDFYFMEKVVDSHIAITVEEVARTEASGVRSLFAVAFLFFLMLSAVSLRWTLKGRKEHAVGQPETPVANEPASQPGPQSEPGDPQHPGDLQGQGKRLILAALGLLVTMGGFGLLMFVTMDRSPDQDAFTVGGVVSGIGLFLTGLGLFGAGKHTSGLARFAAIFCVIGAIGHGLGIPMALDANSAGFVRDAAAGSIAAGLGVLFLGLWAATSSKSLGVFGLICGVFVALAGLSMIGFWLGLMTGVLKLSHVPEVIPSIYRVLVFSGVLLALRLFGRTKPGLAPIERGTHGTNPETRMPHLSHKQMHSAG